MNRKPVELSDEELMALYQQGDEIAFTHLYSRYEGRVYGYLRKRLPDPQAAYDIFQASFLKLHRSKHQFNSSFMFAPWLFAVVRTALLDSYKDRHNRIATIELKDETTPGLQVEVPVVSRHDLSSLSEPQRSAVQLRYFEELSFEEIAGRLETSPGNVRQLVSRGVRSLKALFAKGGAK